MRRQRLRKGPSSARRAPSPPVRYPDTVELPDGRSIDLLRSRWDGVLTPDEVSACRSAGIPLAYDCAQIGWIPAILPDAHDDLADSVGPPRAARHSVEDPVEAAALAFSHRTVGRPADPVLISEEPSSAHRSRIATAVEGFMRRHGVRAADQLHWALHVAARDAAFERDVEPGEGAGPSFSFRRWTLADVPVFVRLLGDPDVWRFLPEPYPDPFTEETARNLIEVGGFGFHHIPMAVEADGVPVGQCLLRFDPPAAEVHAAEVAYWLGRDYWGRGYMSRILPRFTRFCFEWHGVDVLYAWIHRDHGASRRVAERAGYVRDDFPGEGDLAASLDRRDFVRFAAYRTTWDTNRDSSTTE